MGTQEIPLGEGKAADASWQSYLLKLQPVLIVNDSATLKGEISSGYARGGHLGEDFSLSKASGTGHTLYPYSFASGENNLVLNKLYMEFYADTATYQIGRHSFHYGLGAVVNSGEGKWDRFSFARDGITMNVRLGNFFITPFWARIAQGASLTKLTRFKEHGIGLTYKNVEKDFFFGVLYSKRSSNSNTRVLQTAVDEDPETNAGIKVQGQTSVKLTDIYFRKRLGKFDFSLEVPLMRGSIGNVFSANTNHKGQAVIFEATYDFSPKWKLDLKAGRVSGDNGSDATFDAMYLNPNYQVANLLFRYNLAAVSDPQGKSVYDGHITNANYFSLGGHYSYNKWHWSVAFIKAWADQTAQANSMAFNHANGKRFDAVANQENDLGTEIDAGVDYNWNHGIALGASLGLLFPGEYWAFTNDPAIENTPDTSYAFRMYTSVEF